MYTHNRKKGSALIATLTMMAILGLTVGSMLYFVTQSTRSTQDKTAYEQAYQTAMAGTHIARAWLIHPELAGSHFGGVGLTTSQTLQRLQTCATDMSTDIVNDHSKATYTPSSAASTWFNRHGFTPVSSTPLADGRVVLFNFPKTNGRVLTFENDSATSQPTSSLVTGNPDDIQAYVESIRITTTGTSGNTNDPLNLVSLIIESKGVTEYGGSKKERVIQEKVLVYPTIETVPVVSTGAAIIGGAALNFKGSSHFNVHWGPVQSRGHIKLLNFSINAGTKTLNPVNKFYGAGTVVDAPNSNPMYDLGQPMIEKWLKWQAGTGKVLTAGNATDANPTSIFSTLPNAANITDFFAQLKMGQIPGWDETNVTLADKYVTAGTNFSNGQERGLYSPTETSGQYGNGALVQNSAQASADVDYFFNVTMNYTFWKNFAIDRNGYVKPKVSGNKTSYVNQFDQPLYVTPQKQLTTSSSGNTKLTDLNQLSMAPLAVAAGGNTHRNDSLRVEDRILFIDNPNGQEVYSGTPLTHNVGSGFFWKGLMYLNGNYDSAGAGSSPDIFVKSPDQYEADPYGTTRGQTVSNCIMDGIMMVTGEMMRTGNAVVYGTVGSKSDFDGAGTPVIYYNTANKTGRFKQPNPNPSAFKVVSGRIYETNTWLGS